MTDKSKPETLTDADLDGVQGGFQKVEVTTAFRGSQLKQADGKGAKLSRERAEPFIGETEKNIVAEGGSNGI